MESDQHILPGLRTVELTCEVTISGTPERAKGLRAWVPFPVTGRYQRVIEPTMESPTSYRPVIHYDARSEEVVRERFAADLVQGSGASAEEMGKIAAGATAGDNAPLSRARKIYDYVVNTVELDSAGHLLSAAGDNATLAAGSVSDNGTLSRTSRYALDVLTTRKGSAADYATATVMLMRAAGIPAHVETGILLGEDKTPDRTAASENGAWVRFYVNGRGWSACDPYLAKRYPELREAMFGGLSSNRVEMSAGPEPELAPAPAGGQPVLFFAPVAEADGKPVFISMKLSFRDIPGGK
jgi:transglutaminase-like putative cysteine protease